MRVDKEHHNSIITRNLIDEFKKGSLQYNINEYNIEYRNDFNRHRTNSIPIPENLEAFQKYKEVSFFLDDTDILFLTYQGIPVALVSFSLIGEVNVGENRYQVGFIRQIQSVKFHDKDGKADKDNYFLNGFNWGKVLIRFFEIFMKENFDIGNSYILGIIIPSSKIVWPRIDLKQAAKIYDKNASQLGYKIVDYINCEDPRLEPLRSYSNFPGNYMKILD